MPCEHSDRAVESATFAQGAQGGRKTHAQLRAPRPLFRRLLEPPANENVIVTQHVACSEMASKKFAIKGGPAHCGQLSVVLAGGSGLANRGSRWMELLLSLVPSRYKEEQS
ncbi:hypothetical protein H671_6g16054 [Cricetulus griseus]|nr:hypothetical protein H671_6g16054 [Cricetulus griseus]